MFKFLAKSTHQSGTLDCRREFPRHLLHRITTLAISACTALFAQTLYTPSLKAESSDRPNIVLILADDNRESEAFAGGSAHRSVAGECLPSEIPRAEAVAKQADAVA